MITALLSIFLSTIAFVLAIAKETPIAIYLSLVALLLSSIGYFNTKSSELEKALILNAPIECKGAKYSDYITKNGFIVVDSKAFKKYECSVIIDH